MCERSVGTSRIKNALGLSQRIAEEMKSLKQKRENRRNQETIPEGRIKSHLEVMLTSIEQAKTSVFGLAARKSCHSKKVTDFPRIVPTPQALRTSKSKEKLITAICFLL